MWDDYERALLDAYLDWKEGIHQCGRHVSESLELVGRPDPQFVATYQNCLSCKAEALAEKRFMDDWKRSHKDAELDPRAWMIWRVYSQAEAAEIQAQQKQ